MILLERKASFVGPTDHLVLQAWLPSARAASQPNVGHGREHGWAPLEVTSGLGVTAALGKSEGRQCKGPFKSFLHLAPSQLQMAQRCPFQMWTDTTLSREAKNCWGRERERIINLVQLKK